ncbi:hypothetical protein [Mycobacterium sp. IS-3022]|uniref:hypothetical protein n=1 Tax=Mycobacterium sp. IS-3022 TaxID=1772277 RepID=UPI000A9219E6|nr:hypothetical protein [Mycobacterium sp. IS-3022]
MANQRPVSAHLCRSAAAVLLLATATLGGSALVDPATACAEPREWDIGEYDSCIEKVVDRNIRGVTNDAQMLAEAKHCCMMSGGEWNMSAGGPNGRCVAPAPASTQAPWTPPGGMPDAPVHTFAPAEPGPAVPPTFAPANPG